MAPNTWFRREHHTFERNRQEARTAQAQAQAPVHRHETPVANGQTGESPSLAQRHTHTVTLTPQSLDASTHPPSSPSYSPHSPSCRDGLCCCALRCAGPSGAEHFPRPPATGQTPAAQGHAPDKSPNRPPPALTRKRGDPPQGRRHGGRRHGTRGRPPFARSGIGTPRTETDNNGVAVAPTRLVGPGPRRGPRYATRAHGDAPRPHRSLSLASPDPLRSPHHTIARSRSAVRVAGRHVAAALPRMSARATCPVLVGRRGHRLSRPRAACTCTAPAPSRIHPGPCRPSVHPLLPVTPGGATRGAAATARRLPRVARGRGLVVWSLVWAGVGD